MMIETVADDTGYQVNLPEFEGPLDLLLHLVKRHEMDILNIPISLITEKYIEHLELMEAFSVDIAGEYLLMAATLAHLKSRELVPQHREALDEDADDDELLDPRQELIRRLLEYQRYKEVAANLGERPALGREVHLRGAVVEPGEVEPAPLAEVSVFALLTSLNEIIKRTGNKLSYDVIVDRISITDRINSIVDQLSSRETVPFFEVLGPGGPGATINRQDIVVTFLAILEMTRLKLIRVLQAAAGGEIYLTRTEDLRQVDKVDETYA